MWREGFPGGTGVGELVLLCFSLTMVESISGTHQRLVVSSGGLYGSKSCGLGTPEQKHFESIHNLEDNVSTNLKLYQMMVRLAPPNMKIVWIASLETVNVGVDGFELSISRGV